MFQTIIGYVSDLTIPLIFFVVITVALFLSARGKCKPYESFIEGGKEGFQIFLQILPYLVAIIVAIGLFRQCGALDFISEKLGFFTNLIGMPAEVLPVALMKPLSGSGSLGIVSEIINNDPDSLNSYMASTMFGSTDTTFYVLALYFGSVGIKKIRHAMIVGLTADIAGILTAIWISRLMFG
jgi:spore maturation protein B